MTEATPYSMHSVIQDAYTRVHEWFDKEADRQPYRTYSYQSHSKEALERKTPAFASFNFHLYFPGHFFKARHVFESGDLLGQQRLASWLRYNPYLTVIDVGCGDGAGSVAAIETLIHLREMRQAPPTHIYCIGIDPNPQGLVIYERMLDEIKKGLAPYDINLDFTACPVTVEGAYSPVGRLLRERKTLWQQPSLRYAVAIEANLNDLLAEDSRRLNALIEERRGEARLKTYDYQPEPIGQQLSALYCQLMERAPIDHLTIFSVDTKPKETADVVKERLKTIEERFRESNHAVQKSEFSASGASAMENPESSYWRRMKKLSYPQKSFVVSTLTVHHRDFHLDRRWKEIISIDNLELAWARVRQELSRESYSDEIEVRLFERNLEENLIRLHLELDAYAVEASARRDTFPYTVPKNEEEGRPRGLTWLDEEIMFVAIIQVLGMNFMKQPGRSFAYRLSSENTRHRGHTEYLYQPWSQAWLSFRQEINRYLQSCPDGIILQLDVASYYTRIVHNRLQELLDEELRPNSMRIRWLIDLLVNKEVNGAEAGKGLVQGSVGSGFLANAYLAEIDRLFPDTELQGRRLFRYVDDISIVIPNKRGKTDTEDAVREVLSQLGLELNEDKRQEYNAGEYAQVVASDIELDELQVSYNNLTKVLAMMDASHRKDFQRYSADARHWWNGVDRYHNCLTELGFYITTAQLSRLLSSTLFEQVLEGTGPVEATQHIFPIIPITGSIDECRQWAETFRTQNSSLWGAIEDLRASLSSLFSASLEFLERAPENDPFRVRAERRVRFTANRLGGLGLAPIHEAVTDLLCREPWTIRNQRRMLENLGRQGYTDDIWRVLATKYQNDESISAYMHACAIRALRFAPRLELREWNRLEQIMFEGNEVTKLMATETWLALAAVRTETPINRSVYRRVVDLLSTTKLIMRHGSR